MHHSESTRFREVFNGLRWLVRTGAQWRMMPHDLPPWSIVYQLSRNEITLFKSVGTAVQDIAVGLFVYKEATRRGLGQEVADFWSLKGPG